MDDVKLLNPVALPGHLKPHATRGRNPPLDTQGNLKQTSRRCTTLAPVELCAGDDPGRREHNYGQLKRWAQRPRPNTRSSWGISSYVGAQWTAGRD